jgi:hypothetical protein
MMPSRQTAVCGAKTGRRNSVLMCAIESCGSLGLESESPKFARKNDGQHPQTDT